MSKKILKPLSVILSFIILLSSILFSSAAHAYLQEHIDNGESHILDSGIAATASLKMKSLSIFNPWNNAMKWLYIEGAILTL